MKNPTLAIYPRLRYNTKRNTFEVPRLGIYLKEPMRVRKGMWIEIIIPEDTK